MLERQSALGAGADAGVNRAQIDVPAALGDIVGVADVISELRLFAAESAFLGHDC
jgi:hypothetical protein